MGIGNIIQAITTHNLFRDGTNVGSYTKARTKTGRYRGHYILRDNHGHHIGIAYNEQYAIQRLTQK